MYNYEPAKCPVMDLRKKISLRTVVSYGPIVMKTNGHLTTLFISMLVCVLFKNY